MSTAEVRRDSAVKSHKVPRRTLDAMRIRAAEEGVSLISLIRRALDEWLEICEDRPPVGPLDRWSIEPTQPTPTVSVSYQTKSALRRRGVSVNATIPTALDEWLLL